MAEAIPRTICARHGYWHVKSRTRENLETANGFAVFAGASPDAAPAQDRATRTDTPRAAPKTIAEKWRIGSGFDHSSPARERGPGRHTCIGVSKICTVSFARRLPRVVARRLFQTILPDRKAITFHLRRI
jgi:hypothetical protein